MHFKLEHSFDAPVDEVLAALADPGFVGFMRGRMKMIQSIEPSERLERDGGVSWKLRCVPTPIIKSVGPKKVPPEALAFVQEMDLDRKARRATFKNVPVHHYVRAHLENGGAIEFAPNGTSTRRVMTGELKVVGLPFLLRPLAGIAESLIYSNAQKLLEEEASVFRAWLAERKASAAQTV
jgi:hypothetical protein